MLDHQIKQRQGDSDNSKARKEMNFKRNSRAFDLK